MAKDGDRSNEELDLGDMMGSVLSLMRGDQGALEDFQHRAKMRYYSIHPNVTPLLENLTYLGFTSYPHNPRPLIDSLC